MTTTINFFKNSCKAVGDFFQCLGGLFESLAKCCESVLMLMAGLVFLAISLSVLYFIVRCLFF